MKSKAERTAVFIATLAFAFLAAPLPVTAQAPAMTPRVGVLSVAFSASSLMAETFRQALR